ncbi:SusD/RagB family nutrient-binding outer membrane lipoprotein [Fulvivirga sediminis]|uniref:SusD/RagB family nutrient-binding outer membrane lipoprotein n=1 Tax=Fulvivirga sediminis TaxID=2803949 RepID=A0A937F8R4_9BACT|nr:SusD/RagB family nutrient-binding outer membrane lipoprotein [Fulvivirga sediminis]MBL3658401.1 SusD/RagB family nutrient-binding outer membrane lipoprotein [Fulvivirga sediminis]
MRYSKFIKVITFICLLLVASSCADDDLFGDTNTNKEAFPTLDPNLLITTIQASLSGGRLEQWRTNLVYGEGFVQHLGGSSAVSNYGAFFNHNAAYEEALWQSNYSNGLVRYLVDVLERTKDEERLANVNAVAKILKVMVFQRLTDTYGDVPYSEAGQGYYKGIFYPAYDDQKDIYYDFFELLDQAFNQLDDGEQADKITGDNFYEGDISKWKKLANSLRLRCAMRIALVDREKAIAEIESALANGIFQNNNDSCYGHHEDVEFGTAGAQINGNGLSQALRGNGSVMDHPTKTLIRNLQGDPRLTMWFLPGNISGIEGLDANNFSYEHPGGADNLGLLRPLLYRNDAPYLHISYAETQLLLAEAVVRGLIQGNALNYYQNGIRASILQWTAYGVSINAAEARSFAEGKTLTPNNKLEEIITQQWLTHFLNGIEAYANYRRTGMPALEPITRPESSTNGVMPKRIPYPGGESIINPEHFEEANSKYPNGWLSALWWDVE